MTTPLLIRNGRIIDPAQDIDQTAPLFVAEGRIAAIGGEAERLGKAAGVRVIDASGQIVAPGLIDMHVHLRVPGGERAETIASGTAAAVAGGFTAVACMPNTRPALDNDSMIRAVLYTAEREGACRVYPIGALTKGREGKELAEMRLMKQAGAVAFSDDGDGIQDAGVCLKALQYCQSIDALFVQHCEDRGLAAGGCMNGGDVAIRLGLPGLSRLAEDVMVERDVRLARAAGARYHMCHISTAGAVEIIRAAKDAGISATTEVCPHHLLLTDEACVGYDTNFKMNPPLRTRADVEACIEGVRDGTIDCLITDHAPHPAELKALPFQDAPMGIIGLETALGLFCKALIDPGVLSWPQLIRAMSTRPAELLGIPGGTLRTGAAADITLIDPLREWTIDRHQSRSLSRNTPFHGWTVRGKATTTIVGGEVRFADA